MLESWIVLTLLSLGSAPAQSSAAVREQRFFEWTRMPYPKEVYRARRERMMSQTARSGGGVFLAPGRHGVSEGFTFRQLDDFLYFTWLELPDSLLALDADSGRALVFAPARDARYENPSRPQRLSRPPSLRRSRPRGDVGYR